MGKGTSGLRHAEIERESGEAKVYVNLGLDAGTKQNVQTGHPFLDRMLEILADHACINLGISCECERDPDGFLTAREVGFAVGAAIRQALGANPPVRRYGSIHMCSDDALVLVALDLCGKGGLTWAFELPDESVAGVTASAVFELFRTLTLSSGMTLHVHTVAGSRAHPLCDALFRGFGAALGSACRATDRKSNKVD